MPQCDLRPEGCGQCSRAGLSCLGYRTANELRFRDQTQIVRQKARGLQAPAAAAAPTTLRSVKQRPAFRPLHPGWDVLAKQDFFANYVFGLARSYDALGILYQSSTPPPHLVASVDAASLAFFALRQHAPSGSIFRLAAERYVAALGLVNAALADPELSLADHTLQSILLLDLYEKLVNFKQSPTAVWMRHMNGAVSLIRARGEGNLLTYVGRRLTQRLYTTLVISCAITGTRIPDEMQRLRTDLNRYFQTGEDPKWAVTSLNERVINFTCDVQAGKITCPDQIVAQAAEFDEIVVAMEAALPAPWHPRRVHARDDPLGAQATLSGGYDVYETVYFTQVRNVMRVMRLSVLQTIERHAWAQDAAARATAARSQIESCARAVCDSLPQYMLRQKPDGALAWDLDPAAQKLGGYTVFYSLYLAARASRDASLKSWAQRALELVADVGGLAMARRTADALRETRLRPWDVYAMLGSYAIAA